MPIDSQLSSLRILVLGATRGVGLHVTRLALDAGARVTVLVRDPTRMPLAHPSLCVHVGDATNLVAVQHAVQGQDAVISALGAPPTSHAHVRERGARALVSAMEAEGVRRLVMLSSHGILESAQDLPWHMRWLVVPLYLKRAFADHEAQETVVQGHPGLDWTLVRPPHLTDGEPTGTYRHGLGSEVAASMRIPRADVAHFLLHQVPSRDYVHRTPVVSS